MRKRDILILVGLGVVVVIVAWYFLLLKPVQDNASQTDQALQQEKQTLADNQDKAHRLDSERGAARQNTADLLKLNKLVPVDEQIPSLIVELQQTANDAGIMFMNIKPSTPVAGQGGMTTIPIDLKFEGSFFDIDDFLYRVENYARMEGNDINVSGRLVSVVSFKMGEPDVSGDKLPNIQNPNGKVMITETINVYMTSPPPAAPKPAGGSDTGTSTTGG